MFYLTVRQRAAPKEMQMNTETGITGPVVEATHADAQKIDSDIRKNINYPRPSVLTVSLGLAKIKSMELYRELGCSGMAEYIYRLCNDTKTNRSSFYHWLSIGETYLKHKDDLEAIGFCDNDGPSKLSYLTKALKRNEKQAVFDNIKKMSKRDFINFSKTIAVNSFENISGAGTTDKDTVVPYVKIHENGVYIDGELTLRLYRTQDRTVYNYFKRVIHVACKALDDEEVILPVRLRSQAEARRYNHRILQFIDKLRKTGKKKLSNRIDKAV